MLYYRIIAPFLPNIQNTLSSFTGGFISLVEPVKMKRIVVKCHQMNLIEIMEVNHLEIEWSWLEGNFPGKHIIKKEIKDSDGDMVEVKFPKYLKDDDILYLTFSN